MKWPFVKRSTFESTVRDLQESNNFNNELHLESLDKYVREHADADFRYRFLQAELEKERAKSEASQKEVEQTLLDVLNTYVPIRWEPQYHRGYYVTNVCPGEHCEHPNRNGVYVHGDFLTFVRKIMDEIASGWRPDKHYCRNCLPFSVERTTDRKWRVTTAFCGYGGCDAEYRDFELEVDAQAYAKKLYDSGQRINFNSLCSDCAPEYYESCM